VKVKQEVWKMARLAEVGDADGACSIYGRVSKYAVVPCA